MTALRAAIVFALLLPPAASPAVAQPASHEYEVRAAFVLNFVRYVDWPQGHRTPPLRICLFQDNPFGKYLDAAVSGERWQGGPIEIRVVDDARPVRECHLLYVPANATDRFLSVAPEVSTTPVLTVGETPRFLTTGGMIQLFVDANRVRFTINHRSAQSAGLQVSSRLLRLARTVVGESEMPRQ